MIDAIESLGKYEIRDKKRDNIDLFIEHTKLKNTKKVICIVFRKEENNINYNGLHIEDYDSSKNRKYLYRTHQSKRFNITPTTKISYDLKNKKLEREKTFRIIEYWFCKFIPILENENILDKEQINFLKQLKDSISKKKIKYLRIYLKNFKN